TDEYLEALDGVRSEAARMAEEVEAMLRLARSEGGLPEGHREPCDVAEILQTVEVVLTFTALSGTVTTCARQIPATSKKCAAKEPAMANSRQLISRSITVFLFVYPMHQPRPSVLHQ
ncbi:MAG: hypothetical protein OQK42_04265, partial [Sedimenticola sp.]|nr:hypothetical protein [Sedimenticola sp.]